MSAGELICALGLPLLAGAATLLALGVRPRDEGLVFLGTAWPVGALITALLLYAWMSAGWSLVGGGPQVALLALTLGIGALALRRRRGEAAEGASQQQGERRGTVAEVVFLALLALALADVAYATLQQAHVPITSGDSASIWTIRAKMLFHHAAIDGSLGETLSAERGGHHLDYPLMGPLLQVWILSSAGELLDAAVRWPTHLWHLSLVLLVFGVARRYAGPLLGAGLAWLYLSLPQLPIVTAGTWMDLAVAVTFLGLCDRVLRLADEPWANRPQLPLAFLWAALLLWTKNEGAMLLLACAVGVGLGFPWRRLLPRVRRHEWTFALVPLAVALLQFGFNRRYGFENDLLTGGGGEDPRGVLAMLFENLPTKAGPILEFFGRMTIDFSRSRWLFLAYLLALVLGGRAAWSRPTRFIALAVGAGWVGYFAAYVVSFRDLNWHLFTSGGRTTGHLLGGVVLFLACVLGNVAREWRERGEEREAAS